MAKVLVVEDQPSVVAIVRYHLESAGFTGLFAGDVDDAWRLLVAEDPIVAVVDIKLSGPSGWSFIEKVRADDRFHSLPIIVLTGLAESDIPARAAELGCDHLAKPFAASALLEKIRGSVADGATFGAPDGTPRRTDVVSVGVVMLLDNYRIEGKVHLPRELGRFSDAWESLMRDQREFVPVTGARVVAAAGGDAVSSPPFVEVRKRDVRAVYPVDITE